MSLEENNSRSTATQPPLHKKKAEEDESQDDKNELQTPRTSALQEELTQRKDELKNERSVERYEPAGAKISHHGYSYQLKLLIYFLKYGVDRRQTDDLYTYSLATEMKAAEDFDDVIYRYDEGDGKLVYRFLQAKHKDGKKILITRDHLLSETGEFSLKKYYKSFCNITKNPLFKDATHAHFIICTNCSVKERSYFTEINETEEILKFPNVTPKLFKFDFDKFPEKVKLKIILETVEVSEDKMRDYFNELVFITEMPNDTELGHIIAKDISDKFNLMDSILLQNHLGMFVFYWFKDKNAYFLTHEDGERFFKQLDQKVSQLAVAYGTTNEYYTKIESFGMKFKNIPPELEIFLTSIEEQILNVISPHEATTLSTIKIIQVLGDIPAFQKKDSFIAMHLSSILYSQDLVMNVFESETSHDLFIIECEEVKEYDMQKFFKPLSLIVKLKTNKKIILITHKNDTLAEKFKQEFYRNAKFKEIKDEKNTLFDLTQESQENLASRKLFTFQEQKLALCELCAEEKSRYTLAKVLEGELLLKLIKNEEISVSKTLKDPKYDAAKYYFINRTFFRNIHIEKNIMQYNSCFFVIDNTKINESNFQITQVRQDFEDLLVISDTDELFVKCCDKYRNMNVHWLKDGGNEFIWQQSRGSVSQLSKFVIMSEKSETKYELTNIIDAPDKVVLISSEPGMGKSFILSHIAEISSTTLPLLWIIRCNLINHVAKFAEWENRKIEPEDALQFLFEAAGMQLPEACSKECRNFKTWVFILFIFSGDIALLLDGLDEVCPDYKHQVFGLLYVLQDYVRKIWITTRPLNIVKEAENMFNTFSYALKPFSKEDQKMFLSKFFGEKLRFVEPNAQYSNLCIRLDQLLKKFFERAYDTNRTFSSVPLQMYMIAEIFVAPFIEFHKSGDESLLKNIEEAHEEMLNLNSLYKTFVYNKYCEEQRKLDYNYDINKHKPKNRQIDKMLYQEFLNIHRRLAIWKSSGKNVKKLPIKHVEDILYSIKEVEQGNVKSGIISTNEELNIKTQ